MRIEHGVSLTPYNTLGLPDALPDVWGPGLPLGQAASAT